jgi:NAD(P)-dependent dehydrogenase (short-subunit alcohol dehydrogenase family)
MTPITTPFDFRSTAAEVANGIDLSGKRAIVTGAASGIGVENSARLAGTGAAVTLVVRNVDVGVFGVPGTGASRTVERPSG